MPEPCPYCGGPQHNLPYHPHGWEDTIGLCECRNRLKEQRDELGEQILEMRDDCAALVERREQDAELVAGLTQKVVDARAERDRFAARVAALEALTQSWLECPFHACNEFCDECFRRARAALVKKEPDP